MINNVVSNVCDTLALKSLRKREMCHCVCLSFFKNTAVKDNYGCSCPKDRSFSLGNSVRTSS